MLITNSLKILRRLTSIPNIGDLFETEVRVKLLHVLGAYSRFTEADSVYRQLLHSVSPWHYFAMLDIEEDVAMTSSERCRRILRSVSTSSSTGMLTDDDESDASSQGSSRTSIDR